MIALIASVLLGGVFGEATATVESNDGEVMVITIEVEVAGDPETVVAHLESDDRELILPLLDRGDARFGIRTELPPMNYVVVFETVGEESESSEPATLAQLGAELGPEVAVQSDDDEEDLSEESSRLLWLAIALGAASLSVLAFWVLGGREDDDTVVEVDER